MNTFIASLVRFWRRPAVRALYYAAILAAVAWLAAIDATATPAFIYQAF
jgi:hypothetical protein